MTTRQPVPRAGGQGTPTPPAALPRPARAAAGLVALLCACAVPGRQAGAQLAEPPPSLPSVYKPSASATRLMPGQPGWGQASARRAADGHFYFDTSLNGAAVRMVFDTGASTVSLRAEDAARAGIPVGSLDYTLATSTANGATTVAPVVLDSLRVGGVTRRNVRAVVSRPGQLEVSLLGQSFMAKLSGYRLEGGVLILQGE